MSTDTPFALNLNIDPTKMTPAEAATYAADMLAELTKKLSAPAAPAGSPGHIVGIDKQLGRLADYPLSEAVRIKKVHAELTALGYVPTLPTSKKGGDLPSYLSYRHPTTGKNFGNLNSRTFKVMRKDLRDTLEKDKLFAAESRYAYCELTSDAAVDALIKVAADQLT